MDILPIAGENQSGLAVHTIINKFQDSNIMKSHNSRLECILATFVMFIWSYSGRLTDATQGNSLYLPSLMSKSPITGKKKTDLVITHVYFNIVNSLPHSKPGKEKVQESGDSIALYNSSTELSDKSGEINPNTC